MALLRQEVAYIAFHFHWDHETIMLLDHQERRAWVNEIAKIITGMNGER